jgi:DNA-3-methyladenine glycosylase I
MYANYHDSEWGIPVHDDKKLFEMLTLEGAQAGLNWETILSKREGYREVFHGFHIEKVAQMTDEELESLRNDNRIIRNRLKIYSSRNNAKIVLNIQNEFQSFDNYIWGFVNHTQIKNHWETFEDIPSKSIESEILSKDLKKRGMNFVGPTIMYAFMQAVGLIDDHPVSCFKYHGHITELDNGEQNSSHCHDDDNNKKRKRIKKH